MRKVGEIRALLSLSIATLILTAVGVFIDVAVITVAPSALSIAQKAGISHAAILLAMIGGGKVGNVMSPNPNTIAAADNFHVPLTSVMMAGIVPGLVRTSGDLSAGAAPERQGQPGDSGGTDAAR